MTTTTATTTKRNSESRRDWELSASVDECITTRGRAKPGLFQQLGSALSKCLAAAKIRDRAATPTDH